LPDGVEPWDAVERLLMDGKVMITPGLAFGDAGSRWFRLSLVAPAEQLRAAAERIVQVLGTVPAGVR
jgi:LL-diaminopimelate aminotransferase